MKKHKRHHPRKLSLEVVCKPCIPNEGDEIYSGGVVEINISALLEWSKEQELPVVQVPVRIWGTFDCKIEENVQAADPTRPIVIAEIAPDYRDFIPDISENDWIARGYVCIDGQHRIEKARRNGIDMLPAVIMRMEQLLQFIFRGYQCYVEYWNRKLEERNRDRIQWQKPRGSSGTVETEYRQGWKALSDSN